MNIPTLSEESSAPGTSRRGSARSGVARALLHHCGQPAGRLGALPMRIAREIDRTHRTVETVLTELEHAGHIVWIRKRPGGRHRPWWTVKILNPEQLRQIAAEGDR